MNVQQSPTRDEIAAALSRDGEHFADSAVLSWVLDAANISVVDGLQGLLDGEEEEKQLFFDAFMRGFLLGMATIEEHWPVVK